MGLFAAFLAFLSWGFGDFSIQRSARAIGSMPALFFIGAFGAVVLLPWALPSLSELSRHAPTLSLLGMTALVTLFAAIFDFEALKRGKLAIIEPVMSLELAFTIAIGVLLLREAVTSLQILLAVFVFVGILLTVVRQEPRHWWRWWKKRRHLEQGVLLAGLGAIAMAMTNVLTGRSSQETNPVTAIWFIHTSLAGICLVWFLINRRLREVFHDARAHWKPVVAESVFDNAAWLSYATAVTVLPISITIAITESYIVLASVLGIVFNRERVRQHQVLGMVLTIGAAIGLALVTE